MLFVLANTYLNLKELSKKMNISDNRTLLKWIEQMNIPFQSKGREKIFMLWDIEFALQLERAKDLKNKYPKSWQEILNASVEDKRMVSAIIAMILDKTKEQKRPRRNGGERTFFK